VLVSGRDYGCTADVRVISLDDTIYCDVLEVDQADAAIRFDADGAIYSRHGLQAGEPPVPQQPASFPLVGRVVNLENQGIPNVEIRLIDIDESILTDQAGRFEILRPTGSYLLEAVIDGVEVTPPARRFSHRDRSDLPIEFLAHTNEVPGREASDE